MRRANWFWMVAALGLMVGCGDDGASPDAGVLTDADVALPDAQVMDDAQVDPPGECEPGCAATEACVRGVCLATCGAELATLDAELAAALAPIANLCREATGVIDVVEREGGLAVYELAAETVGTTTTFTLSRFTLSADGAVGALETIATVVHEGHAAGAFYLGGYLDVSPDESGALFGYTTSDAGVIGGVFDVEVGDGTAEELSAPGNYDAAWMNAAQWLLTGMGLGTEDGAGLYLRDTGLGVSRRVVDEMGDYSGSVSVAEELVIAGGVRAFGETWPDGSAGDHLFVFDITSISETRVALSAWDDSLAHFEAPSNFEPIGGVRLASVARDDLWAIVGIEARTLGEEGGEWSLGAPEALTSGARFSGIVAAGASHALLVHQDGVLVVALE